MSGLRKSFWLAFSALICACGGGEDGAPPRAKNILLIFTEDHGAHLGVLGTPGAQTPEMDALARRGAFYTNAFITLATCTGSKSTILTGRYNHTIAAPNCSNVQEFVGSYEELAADNPPWFSDPNSQYNRCRIRPEFPTLVEVLRANGYYTGLQNKFHLSPHEKFPFDIWYRENGKPYDEVTDFIGKAKSEGRPWYLQHVVNISHRPYPNADTHLFDIVRAEVNPPAYFPPTDVARQDWQEYLQAVLEADRRVGGVLRALADSGDEDDTLIVLLGDHGPSYHRSKLTTYDLGLRVPLMFVGPGIAAGQTRGELLSGVDLMPTLLDYVGIAVPSGTQGVSHLRLLTGTSLAPVRNAVVGVARSDRSIYDGRYRLIYMPDPAATDMPADNKLFDPWRNRLYGHVLENRDNPGFELYYRLLDLADTDLKVYERPRLELFDTAYDPGEIADLSSSLDYVEVRDRLVGQLRHWMSETADTVPLP
jgi:N-sulfoglucosamine sulfohydrolase